MRSSDSFWATQSARSRCWANGTFQDRLRCELRPAGVRDRDGANAFLAEFLPRYNARFAQPPANPTSAYRPWSAGLDPQTVFCFKYQRVVSNDNTVTVGPHRLQLLPGPGRRSYAKATVEIHERLDGTIAVFSQGAPLLCQRLTATPTTNRGPWANTASSGSLHPDHLWRHMPVGMAKQRTSSPERTKSLNA